MSKKPKQLVMEEVMSKKKIKKAKKTEEKKPNIFNRASTKLSEWKKERAERKAEEQEMAEVAYKYARDIKELADRAALLEVAKKFEEKAQRLRKMASEM